MEEISLRLQAQSGHEAGAAFGESEALGGSGERASFTGPETCSMLYDVEICRPARQEKFTEAW